MRGGCRQVGSVSSGSVHTDHLYELCGPKRGEKEKDMSVKDVKE